MRGLGMRDGGWGMRVSGWKDERVQLRVGLLLGVLTLAACGGAERPGAEVRSAADSATSPDSGAAASRGQSVSRTVAITIDDLPVQSTQRDTVTQWAVTRGIVGALRDAGVHATGFVNEDKLGAGSARDARVRMLQAWLDAGLELGNHTYSHPDLNDTPLAGYTADLVRGEEVTARLRGARPDWFRHPFLHAGDDSAKHAGLRAFLDRRGYRVAPVTIDNGDYVYARAYDLALDDGDSDAARRIADDYLQYMDTVFGFWEAQSRAIVGREIAQTLLLHANRINAETMDELIALMRRRGYSIVPLERALEDPAYGREDDYVGPWGISWLHRWALTDGVDRSIFRGEPEPSARVREASRL